MGEIAALWGWVTRLYVEKEKRSDKRECARPLVHSARVRIWMERRSSVVHSGGWVVQFADKLPFREAWEDLRAFSAHKWVGVFPVWWRSSALRISSLLVSDSHICFSDWGRCTSLEEAQKVGFGKGKKWWKAFIISFWKHSTLNRTPLQSGSFTFYYRVNIHDSFFDPKRALLFVFYFLSVLLCVVLDIYGAYCSH